MKSFDYALLYVLSGTGNTFRVASWIREYLEEKNIGTDLEFIENADLCSGAHTSAKQLTAFLFPTHGFMPPWSMIKFLLMAPRQKKAPAMIVATRGAIWLGWLRIPGAAGFSNFFAAIILYLKGYDVRGFFSLDMPANMNNLHPSLSPKTIKNISEKTTWRLSGFLLPIVAGKRVIFTLNNLYEGIWTMLLFWFIPIFPLLYLIYGKTTMAKIMFANNKCLSCGRCARFCPNNAITMKSFLGKKRPFWTYHCENCMRCMAYCKKKAVEAGHSWAIMQYFLVTLPVVAEILSWLTLSTDKSFNITNYWAMILLDSLYFLPALFISYWLFWILIRMPVINTFFSMTTLTHYFKRFNDPETRLKDFVKAKEGSNLK